MVLRITLIMLVLLIAGIGGLMLASAPTGATALAVPSLTPLPYRDIEIEVLTDTEPDSLFVIGEIFDLRSHEGFQIWTHQSHLWQPGDFFDAGSLDVEVVFDHTRSIEPFIFWRSSACKTFMMRMTTPLAAFCLPT